MRNQPRHSEKRGTTKSSAQIDKGGVPDFDVEDALHDDRLHDATEDDAGNQGAHCDADHAVGASQQNAEDKIGERLTDVEGGVGLLVQAGVEGVDRCGLRGFQKDCNRENDDHGIDIGEGRADPERDEIPRPGNHAEGDKGGAG